MTLKLSITTKLFVGFIALLVLGLGTLALISTFWFIQQESRNLTTFLDSEAKVVALKLSTLVDGVALTSNLGPTDARDALRAKIGEYLAQRLNRPIPYKTTLLILDEANLILGQSNRALELLGPLPQVPEGGIALEDVQDSGPAYRVLTTHFSLGPNVQGTFRVASLLSSLTTPLLSFLTSLCLALGGSFLLLTGLGYWLIVEIMKPVRNMAHAATLISDQNLGARIPLPAGQDDLSRLATTLNSLLARLESEFVFQERLVGELTHQLKTPLTILRGRNELGLATRRDSHDLRELVEDNLSDIDSMVNLLNSILELARYESRIDKLHYQSLDLKALVAGLGVELEPLWASKSFTFHCEGPEIMVLADPTALRQILVNLFDNAWKYGAQGSLVTAHWSVEGDKLRLVVSNKGGPIPEEDLELIFRRFYRSSQVQPEVSGSGLGLSIVRSLVNLHGGTVRAFNAPPGRVSFEVVWPLTPPALVD